MKPAQAQISKCRPTAAQCIVRVVQNIQSLQRLLVVRSAAKQARERPRARGGHENATDMSVS